MVREGSLDPAGFARVDGIESGTCGVVFPELDRGDWRAQGGAFAAPWVVSGAAKRQHVVQQGEHLSRIASRYGFQRSPTIWRHPDNAALSGLRRSPHVLAPGDRVVIPPRQEGIVWVPTSQEHRFVVPEAPLALRLAALDHDHWPVASADAGLEVDGSATTQTTDAKGRIEREITVTAEPGRLVLVGRDLPLRVGHLDPVDTGPGLRARLDHLGYEPGPAEGGNDEELRSAIEELQCDLGLTVDGISGPETQANLVQVHGC